MVNICKCPACGFEFDKDYGRTFGCAGCPSAAGGCGAAKCPKCGVEFDPALQEQAQQS